MALQIIRRLPGETFIVIRSNYLDLCNGNVVAAGLIHIFEQWHIYKTLGSEQNIKANAVARRHDIDASYPETLLQWHTTKELERQLMGLGKKDSIQIARRQLVQLGIISEHKNPNPRYSFDNTTFFLFHPDVVNQLLDLKTDQLNSASAEEESPTASAENLQDSSGKPPYTYNSSNEPTNESLKDNSAADGGSGPKPAPKKKVVKKKNEAPPDTEWQRWVDAWHNFVKARNGVAPMFNGAQLAALKGLRKHLVNVAKPTEGSIPGTTDDCGFMAWEYILKNWDLLDDWLRSQLDLTVVLKKINDILNQLRNGGNNANRGNNSGGSKSGTSAERVDAITNY